RIEPIAQGEEPFEGVSSAAGKVGLGLDFEWIHREGAWPGGKNGHTLEHDHVVKEAVFDHGRGHWPRVDLEFLTPEALGIPCTGEAAMAQLDAVTKIESILDRDLLVLPGRALAGDGSDEEIPGVDIPTGVGVRARRHHERPALASARGR